MTAPVRIGLKLGGQDTTAEELREVWRIADDAGFDHLWCLDVYSSFAEFGPDRPVFEGWALQAAMAVATKRVRIGATFTGNLYRPPWMLAKLAVTVDHLSGGRLEFGIGAGYDQVEDYRRYDIEGLDHRVGRLRESLECMKLLWTGERVDYDGRYYAVHGAVAAPTPVQDPHPPIWIGAAGDALLALVARHADVWNCPGGARRLANGVVEITEKETVTSTKLDELCRGIGRDPKAIRRSVQLPWNGKDRNVLLESCARWLEAGYTEQIVYLDPHGAARAAESAAAVVPELRRLGSRRSSREPDLP